MTENKPYSQWYHWCIPLYWKMQLKRYPGWLAYIVWCTIWTACSRYIKNWESEYKSISSIPPKHCQKHACGKRCIGGLLPNLQLGNRHSKIVITLTRVNNAILLKMCTCPCGTKKCFKSFTGPKSLESRFMLRSLNTWRWTTRRCCVMTKSLSSNRLCVQWKGWSSKYKDWMTWPYFTSRYLAPRWLLVSNTTKYAYSNNCGWQETSGEFLLRIFSYLIRRSISINLNLKEVKWCNVMVYTNRRVGIKRWMSTSR